MNKDFAKFLICSTVTLTGTMGLWMGISQSLLGQISVAQEVESSFSGSRINGRLDSNSKTLENGNYYNIHTFEGKAGEQLTIDLVSEKFNTYLMLLDSEANKIAEDDDSGSQQNAKIIVTLPQTGTYIIAVTSNQAGKLGEYVLSWSEATAKDVALVEAENLNQQAIRLYQQEKYNEAISLAEQALAIRQEELEDNHPDLAESFNILAEIYKKQGRYAEAESYYQQALKIDQQIYGDDHPNVATDLNNLAELYREQGRYAEAESYYLDALAIFKRFYRDKHPSVAKILNNLAELYQEQEKYAEAESHYQQALAIWKQVYKNHPDVAIILNNLGSFYQDLRRYAEAESHYQQALAMKKRLLGDDNHPSVATSFNNLAGLSEAQNDITHALNFQRQGLEIQEYNLSENLIAGSEQQKRDYIATILGTTYGIISLNLQSAPNNPDATNLALTTILQRKGRILDVLTNSLQILRQQSDDPTTQDLLTQLITLRTQYSNLVFRQPEYIKSPKLHRQQLIKLETQTKQLADQLSRRSAEFRTLSQSATLENIQELIPSDSALIELFRYQPFDPKASYSERFDKPRYVAYILRLQGEPQAIDLGEAEIIDKEVQKFRKYLRNPRIPIKQLQSSARKLDKLVMYPVRQLLGDTNNILLSPDADLNLIPFEALVDENNQYLYNQPGEVVAPNQAIEDISQQQKLAKAENSFNSIARVTIIKIPQSDSLAASTEFQSSSYSLAPTRPSYF